MVYAALYGGGHSAGAGVYLVLRWRDLYLCGDCGTCQGTRLTALRAASVAAGGALCAAGYQRSIYLFFYG